MNQVGKMLFFNILPFSVTISNNIFANKDYLDSSEYGHFEILVFVVLTVILVSILSIFAGMTILI